MPTTNRPARSAASATRSGSAMTRLAGGHGNAGKLGASGHFHSAWSDRRKVEPPVLRRLRRFHQHTHAIRDPDPPLGTQRSDAVEHVVGALGRFDRQYPVVGDNDRLPDVERRNRGNEFEPARSVTGVDLGRLDEPERSLTHQNFRSHVVGSDQSEPVLLEHLGDA